MGRADRTLNPGGVERLAGLPVPVLLGGAGALVVLAVTGVLLDQQGASPGPIGMTVALAVSFGPLSLFVLRRLSGHPLGWLMFTCGGTAALAAVSVCWSALLVPAWLSQWVWVPPLAAIPFMLLLF